ncbi:hypothetical protein RJT34_03083 [Clitoria ternatea]|uniref:AAA+ ATPase At3g28540-like C-terminal domain-containing protein n=1 Tax=Clitoria ternatea TaxID=43366 RepID=A0AAN9KMA7_CLITE
MWRIASSIASLLETRRSKILQEPRHSLSPMAFRDPVKRQFPSAETSPPCERRKTTDLRAEEYDDVDDDPKVESDDEDREVEEFRIFMSYCSFPTLKILLKNYLGCEDGDLDESVLKELEEVVELARMTPTDISEVLIKNRHKKEKTVYELLETLKLRAEMNEKMKA